MTLFKITCDTCQTSLNVRQKNAIGQILACPKCGSMVQVRPPEDWSDEGESESDLANEKTSGAKPFVKPVPDPNLPETESNISNSIASEIGDRGTESTGRDTSKRRKPGTDRWQSDDQQAPQASSGQSADPILPGDQWSSPLARQRRKLLIAFTTTGIVLVIGVVAIIYAALQFSGNDGKQQASSQQAPSDQDNAEGDDSDIGKMDADDTDSSQTSAAPKNDGTDSVDADETSKQKSNEGNNGNAQDANPNLDLEKGVDPVEPKTGLEEELANQAKQLKDLSPAEDDKKNADAPDGFGSPSDDEVNMAMNGFFGDLDAFSSMFQQNESLLSARSGFTESDLPGNFGLTRFFVEKSLKKTPDRERALKVPISGLKFEQITLLKYLDFHYRMTSYPVAVDVTPILLAGIPLDQRFDLTLRDTTFRKALEAVANRLGLEVVTGRNSLVLTIPNRDILVESEYPVGDIAASAKERKGLIEQIQIFVDRESWSAKGGKGIITANDEKESIVVKHFGWAQVRVEEFLRHVRVRQGLLPQNPNPNFASDQSRLSLAQVLQSKPLTLYESDPISLSQLSAKLADEFGLHLFINWEATGEQLLPSGSLPLTIDNEPAQQIVSELAETVGLNVVWHNDHVVELTTDVGESSNLTFESYDISNVVTDRFSAADLVKALRKLLDSNRLADFERSAIRLDRRTEQAIFAVLPQSAHRNVASILKTMSRSPE